jgi:hypothetical protein
MSSAVIDDDVAFGSGTARLQYDYYADTLSASPSLLSSSPSLLASSSSSSHTVSTDAPLVVVDMPGRFNHTRLLALIPCFVSFCFVLPLLSNTYFFHFFISSFLHFFISSFLH